jgi:hypothetical protein
MRAMRSRGTLLVGVVAIVLIATAGAAQGAVTIGSNLATPDTTNAPGCNNPCTVTNLALPPASTAPGGLNSPVNGTVTSWRVRANAGPNLRLRILKPGGGTTYTGAGTSGPAGFAGPGISNPIPTSLPISLGDAIGLESPNGNLIFGLTAGATTAFWNMLPVLADGSGRAADGTGSGRELLVQAIVEPTSTLGLSAQPVLNKKKGTATLTISVPNPGQLDFSGTGINIAETAAVKTVTAPGPVKFLIKATGKKLKKLKKKGKVGVTATFTFTPSGGAASTQSTSLKLRKKLARSRRR